MLWIRLGSATGNMWQARSLEQQHTRRVNQAMQERLGIAAQALRQHLPDFDFALPLGGASIWVQAPDWVDAAELALIARSHGVLIEAGDVFFATPPYPCPFFRLRLSSIPSAQIGAGIRALGQAVEELARARRPDHPVARAPALTSRQLWPTPMPGP